MTEERSLPALLLALTVAAGLVDAVSLLSLDRVFVANMTGNVLFLGFALVGAGEREIGPSLVPIVAFLAGALVGGRLAASVGERRARLLATKCAVSATLVAAAAVVVIVAGAAAGTLPVVVLLALAMGLQNATVRRLAVPDLPTTVITSTLTGLVADSRVAGGTNPRLGRRVAAVLALVTGAAVGALLLRVGGPALPLGLMAVLLAATGLAAARTRPEPRLTPPP